MVSFQDQDGHGWFVEKSVVAVVVVDDDVDDDFDVQIRSGVKLMMLMSQHWWRVERCDDGDGGLVRLRNNHLFALTPIDAH